MPLTVDTDVRAPMSVDELTPAWMSDALSRNIPEVRVESCSPIEVIWGMAGKARLQLKYNDAGREAHLPETMVVKAGFGRFPPEMDWTYSVEVWAYRHVVPSLDVNTPRCFFAGIDPHGRPFMLIEDLLPRNVTFCRVLNPLDFQQAAGFLDTYARIHAKWWDSRELRPEGRFGFLKKTLDADAVGFWMDHCLEPAQWNEIVERPRSKAFPAKLLRREAMEHALHAFKAMHDSEPLCVNHGDEHLGNLFIERDGRPGIFDWQTRKAPWHMSVAYFIAGALAIDDRRRWEQALLAYYLERLSIYRGSSAFDWDASWLAYRRSLIWGYFIWLSNPDSTQGLANNVANTSRLGMAVLDHDSFSLI
jgi:Ecdysteroid kinase-like family